MADEASTSRPAKHLFREPRPDMIAAGMDEMGNRRDGMSESALIRNIWRRMHDAAPV